ncbi:hypothetical protein H8356DRAFT_1350762 [Neocallimastix lanati (nom. inval.)]|nr:hypothetical protein H8356DRAFT_1350762 [Neocallimastix sp. JGI-2020a]
MGPPISPLNVIRPSLNSLPYLFRRFRTSTLISNIKRRHSLYTTLYDRLLFSDLLETILEGGTASLVLIQIKCSSVLSIIYSSNRNTYHDERTSNFIHREKHRGGYAIDYKNLMFMNWIIDDCSGSSFAKKIVQINDFIKELIVDLRHTLLTQESERHEDYDDTSSYQHGQRLYQSKKKKKKKEFLCFNKVSESETQEDEEIRKTDVTDHNISMEELKYSLRSGEILSYTFRVKIIYYYDIIPPESSTAINKHVMEI